jgi:hypothetical protein
MVSRPGTLYARSTWSDPNANLKIEIWRGLYQDLLVTAFRRRTDLCVTASTSVSTGFHVVVTCHTADSASPSLLAFGLKYIHAASSNHHLPVEDEQSPHEARGPVFGTR